MIKRMYTRTELSKGAIWDEFSEQNPHQASKSIVFQAPFFANIVQI